MRGLTLTIYTPSYGNCSNNGVSATCKQVTLVGPGIPEIFEAGKQSPAVEIKVNRNGYKYIGLVDDKRPGMNGPMFGGCVVWSTDSRIREIMPNPMALHDRYENWEG